MLFRKKKDPELEKLIAVMQMDMSNNYKDAAQDDFRKVKECFARKEKELPDKQRAMYAAMIQEYEKSLVGYTHKDQPVQFTAKI